MKYDFDIEPGNKVSILELELEGRVKAIYITRAGATYLVRYFWDCNEKDCYFYPDEIKKLTKGNGNE